MEPYKYLSCDSTVFVVTRLQAERLKITVQILVVAQNLSLLHRFFEFVIHRTVHHDIFL